MKYETHEEITILYKGDLQIAKIVDKKRFKLFYRRPYIWKAHPVRHLIEDGRYRIMRKFLHRNFYILWLPFAKGNCDPVVVDIQERELSKFQAMEGVL